MSSGRGQPIDPPRLDAATVIAQAARTIGACLPGSTEIVAEAAAVPPDQRYWLVHEDGRLTALVPQAVVPAELPSIAQLHHALREGRPLSGRLAACPLGVVLPAARDWPGAPGLAEEARPVVVNRPQKVLTFPVDVRSGAVLRLIKRPKHVRPLRNCRNELALLSAMAEAGIGLGPAPRGTNAAQDTFHYEFIPGRLPTEVQVRTFGDFVRGLESGRVSTLRDEARRYAAATEALDLDRMTRDLLLEVLDRVRDTAAIPCGITHGDLKPGNLVLAADGRLRAVDWETGTRDDIPFFDLVRLSYAGRFAAGTAATLREFFSGPGSQRIGPFMDHLFPLARPALPDLLALYFSAYCISRLAFFDEPGNANMRYVTRLLGTADTLWP